MAAWTQRLPGTRSRSAAIWATLLSAFPALVPERRGAHTVLTALLDRSALYGVLAECETLGLDLVEVRGGAKEVGVAEGHLGGAESHLGAGLLGQETGGDGARVGEVDDDLVTPRGRGVAAVDREHPQRRLMKPRVISWRLAPSRLPERKKNGTPAYRQLATSARTAAMVSVCEPGSTPGSSR